MKYRLIVITYRAQVRTTDFEGWFAEETADQKFNEVRGDSKTKYVVLLCSKDAEWFVRQEAHFGADS